MFGGFLETGWRHSPLLVRRARVVDGELETFYIAGWHCQVLTGSDRQTIAGVVQSHDEDVRYLKVWGNLAENRKVDQAVRHVCSLMGRRSSNGASGQNSRRRS